MNAAREISNKSQAQIHRETAQTWARRAIAYRRAAERTAGATRLKMLRGFDDARHEALEHAALAEDGGATLRRIERMINRPRGKRR